MLFAFVLPWFWEAIAIIVAAAWLIRRRYAVVAAPRPRSLELLIPFAFPIAIVVWAAALYASLERKHAGWHWQALGLSGLLVLQVGTIVWLLIRHRGRLAAAIVVSVVAVCWAVGAMFVGGMAVYNDWL